MRYALRLLALALTLGLILPPGLAAPAAKGVDPHRRSRLVDVRVSLTPAPDFVLEAAHQRRLGERVAALTLLEASAQKSPSPEVDLLLGVLRVELERFDAALEPLVRARTALPILADTIDLYLGLALSGADDADQASQVLRRIPRESPHFNRARRIAAELDLARGATAQALFVLGTLAGDAPWESLDPRLLLLMGQALEAGAGTGTDDLQAAIRAYQLAAVRYPEWSDGKEAALRLERLAKARGLKVPPPSYGDRYAAARSYLNAHLNERAAGHFKDLLSELPEGDPLRCDVALDLGRAYQKERQYTDSVAPLTLAMTDVCPEEDQVKAIYLLGRAHGRRGLNDDALKTYTQLIRLYPDHSMADDAYLLSAVIHLERGDLKLAEDTLKAQLSRYPQGDMAPEGAWRLAWTAAEGDRLGDAISHLDAFLDASPDAPADDRLRARYWSAWWGHKRSKSKEDRGLALAKLERLARDAPLHFYGAMAYARVRDLDAQKAKAIQRPAQLSADAPPPAPTLLDPAEESEGVLKALKLVKSGLPDLGRLYLSDVLEAGAKGDARLRASFYLEALGLYELSVGLARAQILESRFTEVTPETLPWFAQGFPLAFQPIIEGHAIGNGFDPLLLFGLIREESNFDDGVRSWAGAMGLTQLMWPTAQDTARKENVRITRAALREAETNVRLGARYLGDLLKRYDATPGLAVPGYNAGPGAVDRWVKARGDQPFDAWVEQIPYDQTRDYVKRVLGSYQTYHYLYRVEADPFIEMPLTLP